MPKSTIAIYATTATVLLIGLFAAALWLVVKPDAYRSQIAANLADALRMEVTFGGPMGFTVLPALGATLEDVQVRNNGLEIVSARKVTLGINVFSLLSGAISIHSIALEDARIFVERDQNGRFNFQTDRRDELDNTVLDLPRLSLSNAALHFTGQQPWQAFETAACNLDVRGLRVSSTELTAFTTDSFSAELECDEIDTQALTLSDVKVSVNANTGVVTFEPITLHVLDADGTGRATVDLAGAIPQWDVQFSLPRFPIEAFLQTQSPQNIATGLMDFSTHLSMQGTTVNEMIKTTAGPLSLRGSNLTLDDIDLDEELSQLESSRNFSLVDVGAFFLAGPLGLAVTKGYGFATLLQGSGGTSEIRTLMSDWQVEHGIMRAQDVAMATIQNRIALQGSLDFINGDFDDVIVALVDSNGCIEIQQAVKGSFVKPVVEQPNVLEALARPAIELVQQGQDLLSSDPCEVFYSGSVAAPT